MDKLLIRLGEDINFYGVIIKQPTIKKIADLGEKTFDSLCSPFLITNQVVDDDDIKSLTPFDMFFENGKDGMSLLQKIYGGEHLEVLSSGIQFFTGEEVKVLENLKQIIVGDKLILDVNNFEEFREIIKGISYKEDIEIEHPPRNMSPRQLDIWEKLKKGRERNQEEGIYLQDMINYVSIGGGSYIPNREISAMTLFEFRNICKTILELDSYRTAIKYMTSFKFDIKEEIEHWTSRVKIGK